MTLFDRRVTLFDVRVTLFGRRVTFFGRRVTLFGLTAGRELADMRGGDGWGDSGPRWRWRASQS